MTSQLKTARVQRDALLARGRRAKTSRRLHGVSGSATDAFDRMEDRLTRDSDLAAAREQLERDLAGDTGALDDLEGPENDLEADELLEKLKRQMEADKGGK
jgi:phage shock protein A